ncbi:MAG TPA: hypothetical protein VHW01_19080, partial [Polyangiaceae bacterium]|nr:hypothetical protein [Polyangiaceae bacterium]
FPDPNGSPRPPAPVVPQPLIAPSASPAPAPAAPADSTTDSRYPILRNPVQASAPPISASALSLNPGLLPYRAGLPIPAGYRIEHHSANGLIGGGLALFGVSYIAALAVGAGDGFGDGTGWTVVPVIGPWAAIGARSYHCSNDTLQVTSAVSAANKCVNGAFNQVQTIAILSADAVIQATGAVLFFAGLASGQDELVRSDLETGLRVTPRAVGSTGFGVGFDGRF